MPASSGPLPNARLLGEAYAAGFEAGCRRRADLDASTRLPSEPAIVPTSRAAPPTFRGVPEDMWLPVLHANGERACNQPALCLTGPVSRHAPASLGVLRIMVDGAWRAPVPADAPRCASCAEPVNPWTSDDLDFEPCYARDDAPPTSATASVAPFTASFDPEGDRRVEATLAALAAARSGPS